MSASPQLRGVSCSAPRRAAWQRRASRAQQLVVAASSSSVELPDDEPAPVVDIKLSSIELARCAGRLVTRVEWLTRLRVPSTQGKRIGSGSFGDVFSGEVNGKAVILKKSKGSVAARRFFEVEAAVLRRLKGNAGVPPFLGVGGANVYLVWKEEKGATGLDVVLAELSREREGTQLAALASALGTKPGLPALKALARALLKATRSVHEAGVVHRDIKPANVLLLPSKKALLIDLGAAADLVAGEWSSEEAVFDPLWGPPERFLDFPDDVKGAIPVAIAWARYSPDKFDAFSAGMVLLQVGVPAARATNKLQRVKSLLCAGRNVQEWRDAQPESVQADFELLDADGGAGWKLVCGLLESEPKKRMGLQAALGSKFAR